MSDFPADGAPLDQKFKPEVVRHNSSFLVPRLPDGGAGWLPPSRPIFAEFDYHAMICETIYAKGAKDLERVAQHMERQRQLDEERAAWSRERFSRQRKTAELWADMRETTKEVMPKVAPVPQERRDYNPWDPVHQQQPSTPLTAFGAKVQSDRLATRGAGLFSPMAAADNLANYLAAPPSTRDLQESASAPSLAQTSERWRPTPGRRPRGLMQGGPKAVVHWPGGWVPKQAPGDRGLPPGYIPAKDTVRGDLMWPDDLNMKREKRAH